MKKTTFLTKAAALLIVALFSLTGARAAEVLTVYDGGGNNTNDYVPIYGYYVDNFSKSQFIIPAAKLNIMSGCDIIMMTFYASQSQVNWGRNERFEVYLSEVSGTTISSLQDNWGTLVYSGRLAVSEGQMLIPFTNSYKYNGGNLLVGIKQTAKGSYVKSSWYGENVSGASMGGYSTNANNNNGGSITQQNFIPKTTFKFLPGHTATNVAVSNITETTANVSWSGNADSYIVKYRTKREGFFEDFNSSWGDWRRIKANGGPGWSLETPENQTSQMACAYSWDGNSGNNGYNADNWLISPAVELGGTLKFDVLTSVWHDKYEVKLCTTDIADVNVTSANVASYFNTTLQDLAPGFNEKVDIDLAAYSGTGYIAIHHQHNNGHYLDIDNFEVSAGHAWKTKETTAKTVQLTDLLPDTEYEVIIVGIKNGLEAKTPNTTFTTLDGDVEISLANAGDNNDLVFDLNGKTYDVRLADRSFSNGKWYTLCLPFNVTIANSPLAGAEACELDASTTRLEGKTLKLNFTNPVTELVAGTPYIIRWTSNASIANPLFEDVTFSKTMHDAVCSLGNGRSITFKGSYAYQSFTAVNQSILFISSNKIYYVGDGTTIGAQRGYFQLDGLTYGTSTTNNGIKEFAIILDGDDPDGINDVNVNLNDNDAIYNLAGQRINKMQRGINIVNGKKIFVK